MSEPAGQSTHKPLLSPERNPQALGEVTEEVH